MSFFLRQCWWDFNIIALKRIRDECITFFIITGQRLSTRCPNRDWAFERVAGFALSDKFERRRLLSPSREVCVAACLSETEFECRSANYDRATGMCTLSDMDRQSIATNSLKTSYERRSQAMSLLRDPHFGQTDDGLSVDYFENNCVQGTILREWLIILLDTKKPTNPKLAN